MASEVLDPVIDGKIHQQRLQKMEAYQQIQNMALQRGADQYVAVQRELAKKDLFYLLVYILKRPDANQDFVFARCQDVMANPNGYIDLWSRAHYKSTVLTFALNIQEILNNPNVAICIISYNKTMAESFVAQIKVEFETNPLLKKLFPDVLWGDNPSRDAIKWSVKDGFSVRRTTNSKEQTVEGYGLEYQPTGKHFMVLSYDDIVIAESVTTAEMIEKTTTSWETSLNLGNDSPIIRTKIRMAGTRWHQADTYAEILKRGFLKERRHPCTEGGKWPGRSIFLPADILEDKYRAMGSRTFNAQMLLNPTPADSAMFKIKSMQYWYADNFRNLNVYIIVDPSNHKAKKDGRKRGDYTCMWVIGMGPDRNYYILDCVRDKLNQRQRIDTLFELHEKYRPIRVGWEGGAMSTEVEAIEYAMNEVNYRFDIVEIPNKISKHDRIANLEGDFMAKKFFFPRSIWKMDWQGNKVDLIQAFIYDEFTTYPFCSHDDMLDALSFIKHPELAAKFPGKMSSAGASRGDDVDFGTAETYDALNY